MTQNKHFVTHPIDGNGSCLFQSISYLLFDTTIDHSQYLRNQCVNEVRNNPSAYKNFMTGTVQQYINFISQENSWGGGVCTYNNIL